MPPFNHDPFRGEGQDVTNHKSYVPYPEVVEDKFTSINKLKAEISKVLSHAKSYHTHTGEAGYQLTKSQYEELLKLSAI